MKLLDWIMFVIAWIWVQLRRQVMIRRVRRLEVALAFREPPPNHFRNFIAFLTAGTGEGGLLASERNLDKILRETAAHEWHQELSARNAAHLKDLRQQLAASQTQLAELQTTYENSIADLHVQIAHKEVADTIRALLDGPHDPLIRMWARQLLERLEAGQLIEMADLLRHPPYMATDPLEAYRRYLDDTPYSPPSLYQQRFQEGINRFGLDAMADLGRIPASEIGPNAIWDWGPPSLIWECETPRDDEEDFPPW
jgi:hypothetical protein